MGQFEAGCELHGFDFSVIPGMRMIRYPRTVQ